jgi:hypothetical protein
MAAAVAVVAVAASVVEGEHFAVAVTTAVLVVAAAMVELLQHQRRF